MGEGSLWFYLEQKKDTTKSKVQTSFCGADVAQFPTGLNNLGGNAENQVNG